jgi:hypothetical protein
MKRLSKYVAVALAVVSLSGCADYWAEQAREAAAQRQAQAEQQARIRAYWEQQVTNCNAGQQVACIAIQDELAKERQAKAEQQAWARQEQALQYQRYLTQQQINNYNSQQMMNRLW